MKQLTSYIITKFDRMSTIPDQSPLAAGLLGEFGLHCFTCAKNDSDTVENAAKLHHMSDEEINTMVKEINTELEKEWRKEMREEK